MKQRPPIAKRTDTLFTYTTLYRSPSGNPELAPPPQSHEPDAPDREEVAGGEEEEGLVEMGPAAEPAHAPRAAEPAHDPGPQKREARSEEHTSELQSLMRPSYAVFCLKKTIYNAAPILFQVIH